jgi:hypothetical protein
MRGAPRPSDRATGKGGQRYAGPVSEQHRFRARIEAARGGGAVALIPPDVTTALGGPKQMRVTGTLNGAAFNSSTMPNRGAFYLGVHKATREAAGAAIGDEVEIELTRDDSPRVLELAPSSKRRSTPNRPCVNASKPCPFPAAATWRGRSPRRRGGRRAQPASRRRSLH